MSKNYIKFLGTAGSRWVVARQLRASGGVYLNFEGTRAHLDPGPGALVRYSQCQPPIDPAKLNAIIITHSHIDHCNDVNIMLDAMTGGGFNRGGALFAPTACLDGEDAVVMRYLRPFLDEIVPLEPEGHYQFQDLAFTTSGPHDHGVETLGVTFDVDECKVSFVVDTKFFPELPSFYTGSDLLVINVTFLERPSHPRIMHLCIDDVRAIARAVRPRKVVLTHFGMSMLEAGPERIAKDLAGELGTEVVAAADGMTIEI